MKAEVTLFFNGASAATEYFEASCPTDVAAKAIELAKRSQAVHFNFGLATEPEFKKVKEKA
jgi:hypothetical protein